MKIFDRYIVHFLYKFRVNHPYAMQWVIYRVRGVWSLPCFCCRLTCLPHNISWRTFFFVEDYRGAIVASGQGTWAGHVKKKEAFRDVRIGQDFAIDRCSASARVARWSAWVVFSPLLYNIIYYNIENIISDLLYDTIIILIIIMISVKLIYASSWYNY